MGINGWVYLETDIYFSKNGHVKTNNFPGKIPNCLD